MQTPLMLSAIAIAITFFSVLAALRFWNPVSNLLGDTLGLAAGISAALVFIVLLVVFRVLVSYILNNKAKAYKPAADNTPDKGIGALAGFASGMLLGSTLALLLTVGSAGGTMVMTDFSKPVTKRVEQLPIFMFRFVEHSLARIPDGSGTLLPSVVENEGDPANSSQTKLIWE